MSIGLKERFGAEKPVIAMAHLPPMPGTPLYDDVGGAAAIVESVRRDVEILTRSASMRFSSATRATGRTS